MQTINRSLLYILPKKKCIDWVNSIYPEAPIDYASYILEHDSGDVYLIREFDDESEVMAWMKKGWKHWFEDLLMAWCMDEELWPENRSWELLNEFFDIKWQSLIEDTLPQPIKKID
jgi:hypothetical protein